MHRRTGTTAALCILSALLTSPTCKEKPLGSVAGVPMYANDGAGGRDTTGWQGIEQSLGLEHPYVTTGPDNACAVFT